MKTMTAFASLIAGTLLTATAMAQAPSSAPAGTTGLCKDGSFWSGPTKKGACRGHKGVKEWYAAAPAAAAAVPAPAMPMAKPATAAPATPTASAAPSAMASKKAMPAPAANAAPGGGPGMVWVNSSSKVYHCPSDKWYGKTKQGSYMTEAAAKAAGDHGSGGKTCSS